MKTIKTLLDTIFNLIFSPFYFITLIIYMIKQKNKFLDIKIKDLIFELEMTEIIIKAFFIISFHILTLGIFIKKDN